jgi:predicted O-methyltransferase YrrM
MDLMSFISVKIDISLNLHKTIIELENLDKQWVVNNVPLSEHNFGRIPGEHKIKMWSIPRSSMKLITMFAIVSKSKNLIELGTSAGYSAIWLSIAAKINNGMVHTIDIFKPKVDLANKYINQSGMSKYINLIYGDITEHLSNWSYGKLDFVLFDADKENHLKYLKILEPNLSDNALLIVDNASNFRHLQSKLFEYLDSSDKYLNYWHDYENGLEIFTKVE